MGMYKNQAAVKKLAATDERQYMLNESYEVYEKEGAPVGAEAFHYHNFYEIIYVMEGEFAGTIENRTYYLKKGDFLIIDRNVMHKYHYIEKVHDSSKRIILWVSEEMLNELSYGGIDLTKCFGRKDTCACHFPIYYEEMLRMHLLRLVQEDAGDVALTGAKETLDRAYLTLFFVYLNELCTKKEYGFAKETTIYEPMVKAVSDYIEEHIKEPVMLDELAEHVHMSKYYFLRKFKALTGMTVHAYIINKRLIKACELIKENYPVSVVWQESGFQDYSSFLRNYKKAFGVSPRDSYFG